METSLGVGHEDMPGATLREVLVALGEPLVQLVAAPDGLEVEVSDVVIFDPDDEPDARPGDLVLVIGARGRSALPAVRAAARRGTSVVAVKADVGRDGHAAALRGVAADAGVAVLAVRPEARWEQIESLARGVVSRARLSAESDAGEVLGDLFSLAQTIAGLTGGSVSIEDTASRVLAYSRSSDEVDELRRLSILGRQGPEPYQTMLRDWGVYQRLRSGEEVVRIEERPELGIRRRLAVGIHAAGQPLGTIWVQEGAQPLAAQAEQALLGAARVTALHLVRHRTEPSADLRLREDLLAGLLEGRTDAAPLVRHVGIDEAKPAVVVAFALRTDRGAVVGRSGLELRRGEATSVISVHSAAYRRAALVTLLGSRIYALLPELAANAATAAATTLTRDIVGSIRRQTGLRVQAAIGRTVHELDEVRASRREADRVLDAIAAEPDRDVAGIADVRAEVLLSETLALLSEHPHIRDPRLAALNADDAKHDGRLGRSLLAFLDAFGEVRTAAEALGIHPNTLRYRVRRAAELTGIDLDDPRERLVTQLQLRLGAPTGRE